MDEAGKPEVEEDPVVVQNRALAAENAELRATVRRLEIALAEAGAEPRPERKLDRAAGDRFARPYDGR